MENWDDFLLPSTPAASNSAKTQSFGAFGTQNTTPAFAPTTMAAPVQSRPSQGNDAFGIFSNSNAFAGVQDLSKVPTNQIQSSPLFPQPLGANATPTAAQGPLDAFTAGEKNYYATFYRLADVDGDDKINSQEAVTFFRKSGLENAMLSQIWRASNPTGKQVLDRPEFYMAMRLIAAAQQRRPFEPELTRKGFDVQYPPPKFEGLEQYGPTFQLNATTAAQTPTQFLTPTPATSFAPVQPIQSIQPVQPAQPAQTASKTLTPITKEDYLKYSTYFDKVDTDRDGEIFGQVAKDFFLLSKLDQPTLSKIWQLSDVNKDMKLNRHEFIISMALVTFCRQGNPAPASLPADFLASTQTGGAAQPQPQIQIQIQPQALAPMPASTSAFSLQPQPQSQPLFVDLNKNYHLFGDHDENPHTHLPPVTTHATATHHQVDFQLQPQPQPQPQTQGWATFGASQDFASFGSTPATAGDLNPSAFVPATQPKAPATNKVFADGKFTLPTATFEQRANLDSELSAKIAARKHN